MKKYNPTTDSFEDYSKANKVNYEDLKLKLFDKRIPYTETSEGLFIDDEVFDLANAELDKIKADKQK